jgi:hypothetical protein
MSVLWSSSLRLREALCPALTMSNLKGDDAQNIPLKKWSFGLS